MLSESILLFRFQVTEAQFKLPYANKRISWITQHWSLGIWHGFKHKLLQGLRMSSGSALHLLPILIGSLFLNCNQVHLWALFFHTVPDLPPTYLAIPVEKTSLMRALQMPPVTLIRQSWGHAHSWSQRVKLAPHLVMAESELMVAMRHLLKGKKWYNKKQKQQISNVIWKSYLILKKQTNKQNIF